MSSKVHLLDIIGISDFYLYFLFQRTRGVFMSKVLIKQ